MHFSQLYLLLPYQVIFVSALDSGILTFQYEKQNGKRVDHILATFTTWKTKNDVLCSARYLFLCIL